MKVTLRITENQFSNILLDDVSFVICLIGKATKKVPDNTLLCGSCWVKHIHADLVGVSDD
jgi:hypothetical protein